jgi:hypothetical protein
MLERFPTAGSVSGIVASYVPRRAGQVSKIGRKIVSGLRVVTVTASSTRRISARHRVPGIVGDEKNAGVPAVES